jgi:hypothetical protein
MVAHFRLRWFLVAVITLQHAAVILGNGHAAVWLMSNHKTGTFFLQGLQSQLKKTNQIRAYTEQNWNGKVVLSMI